MNSSPSSLSIRLAVAGLLSVATFSSLADQTWKGTTDNQWTTTGNWSGAAIPGSSDQVAYNASSTGNLSNWLSTPFSIAGILFTNPAGPVSINSASTLTLGAGGINLSNATQTLAISGPVALGISQTWVVGASEALTVSGPVSGGFGLYKDGLGTLVLSGTNTFTGNFTNNGGAVWINNNGGLGSGSKTVFVANNALGAGLHLNGTNGNITLASGIGYTLSQQFGAIINEAGDNVINGPINVFSGGGYAYILANAGTLTLNGGITLGTTARPITLGGAANGTNNGGISGANFPFRKVDSGTWVFTGNNPYTSYTTVEGGTLVLGPNGKIGGTTNITVFAGATLDVSAVTNAAGLNALVLATNQVLAGSGTVRGNVNATAAGTLFQPGSQNLAQVAGGMAAVGTLTISGNLTQGAATTNFFELNPVTTPGGGTNDLITVGGNLDPQNAYISISTLNGITNGTYRLFNYSGAKLSSFNPACLTSTYRGTFAIDESVTNQINLVVSGVVNTVWRGTGSSSTWDLNTTADWNANTLTFFNGDSVTFDDTGVASTVNLSGTVQPGTVTFNNSAVSYTLAVPSSGKVTGSGGLLKSGSGTLTITATGNDFTGPVTVNGGILSVGSMAVNGSASTLGAGTTVVLNGGTFQFTGARPGAGVVNRLWTLGAGGGTVQSTTATFFMANQISGPGALTKTGTQQLILGDLTAGLLTAANNTYAGNTFITAGEVQIRNAHALGYGKAVVTAGADLAVGGGANYGTVTNDIDLNGPDSGGFGAIRIGDTSTGVTFGGTITLLGNSSIGSQNASASSLTFNISGPIVGSGSLTKLQTTVAPVTCTLGGSNTYSGNTIITGGTLAVGLSGTGSINNSPNISIATGAKLQLNAGGSLGSSVNISLATGGYFDVNGLGAGTTYTLGANATLNASGTGLTSGTTQSEIHGNATGTVSLGSRPISLAFTPVAFTGDTTHPSLVISQGALLLNNNTITISNATTTALGAGVYRLIQVTSGSTSGTPNATPFITGKGLAANCTATLSVSSGNVILTVASTSPTATTTTLSSLTGSSYGSAVTFTATVSPTPTGGTVQFYDNGVAIGSPATVSSGTATLTTGALGAGSHPITAAYSGTTGFGASATASASAQTVSAVALSITANADSKTYGQTKIYAAGSTAFTSSGLQNGDVISSVTITASGGTASNAAATTYSLTPSAAVGGTFNANNYAITYNNGTLTVNPAPLGVTAGNTNKVYNGVPFSGGNGVSYAGFVNGETSAVLGGSLSYGGTSQGAINAGSYTIIPSGLTAANYAITYVNGTLTINPATPALTLSSSANPSGYSNNVSFTATLPVGATGNVIFSATNAAISTNALAGGVAGSATVNTLPRGTNVITAVYTGDNNYLGSTNTLNQIVTNHPPVANANAYTRSGLNQWKILVSDLLTNATDVDGDTLALDSVATSTNGVTVVITSGYVMYLNTNLVADQFTYTVTDGNGGTNGAVITLALGSASGAAGQVNHITVTGGTASLSFAGIPGYLYHVQVSTNLLDWNTIWTTNTPAGGVFDYTDGNPPQPSAYYRLMWDGN
ncbi:MAG: Ig-like domain repeat protein [Verrucomicrobiae bacterium]|nr:Ig-like domain repeat protein [Verrucomicrobiae bacterium]